MKVAIVVPTYNEKENIVPLIRAIVRVLQISQINRFDADIIVVDDSSPDKTAQAVFDLRFKNDELRDKVKLISRPKKMGLGTAYIAGFKKALKNGADCIMTMDADLSHNPKDIPRLVRKIDGYDLIFGSRYVKKKGGK